MLEHINELGNWLLTHLGGYPKTAATNTRPASSPSETNG